VKHDNRILIAAMLLYGGASLLHFTHNAQFVADYPNLPPALSAARIYGAWLVIGSIGLAGYLLMRRGHQFWGLAVVAMGAHSWGMNLSIWFEVVTAAVLFALVLMRLRQSVR
jgi:uncharacterized membrane protein